MQERRSSPQSWIVLTPACTSSVTPWSMGIPGWLVARGIRRVERSTRSHREVKTLRDEQPPTDDLDEPAVTRSALTVDGAGAATMALDVMVSSMVALSATEDEDASEVLIGTCIDAARLYEGSTAIVKAASQSHGSEVLDLKRAFDADGEAALRNRVVAARARLAT